MLFREEDEDLDVFPFADRFKAGRILATKLTAYSNRSDVVALGLARGGVLVASAVANALHVPLDVFLVSKIRTPWNEELAMGALTENRVQVLDLSIIRQLCISEDEIAEAVSAARKEVAFREELYRRDRPPLELKGKTVILVDDGIATGCSTLAAVAAVRRRAAAHIVVAVPASPREGTGAIRMEADDMVAVAQPERLFAVSQCYRDFGQVSDEIVQSVLEAVVGTVLRAA